MGILQRIRMRLHIYPLSNKRVQKFGRNMLVIECNNIFATSELPQNL